MTSPTPVPAQTLGLSLSTDAGDFATMFAMFFKMVDGINQIANSPVMIAARQNAAVQAVMDKITADANAALLPGASLVEVEKDLSA